MRKNMFLLVSVMIVLLSFALVPHAHAGKPLAEGENYFTDTTGNYEKQFEALKDGEALAFDSLRSELRFENYVNVYLSDNNITTIDIPFFRYFIIEDPLTENRYVDENTQEIIISMTERIEGQLKGYQPGTDAYIRKATELTVEEIKQLLDYDKSAIDENNKIRDGYDSSLAQAMVERTVIDDDRDEKVVRIGICKQFAKLACRILRELGVEAEFIGGDAAPFVYVDSIVQVDAEKKFVSHAWIRIKTTDGNGIDGWYYSDPTWYEGEVVAAKENYLFITEENYKTHYKMNEGY